MQDENGIKIMFFFYLSHFIQAWMLPPGFNVLVASMGFLFERNFRYIGKIMFLFAIVSLWLLSTPLFAQLLIDTIQHRYSPFQINKARVKNTRSAIVVLGGGHEISPEAKNGYILSDETESRLRYTAYLYRQTHFPIIVSGGSLNPSELTEAELMRRELRDTFGILNVWKENKSLDTKDEGRLIVPILQKYEIKTIYLVTHAFHMPRAMYIFKKSFQNTGIKINTAPTGYQHVMRANQKVLNYLPSLDGLNTSVIAIHEYLGLLAYRFYK